MELNPASAGFSKHKLDRLQTHLQQNYITPQKIPGCRLLVARKGNVASSLTLGLMDLERNLSMLSTIASISPLLGLLGTVVGMITVFSNIDVNGSANTDLLAAGISEALITTAFGLIIAVPSIVFYRYFEQKTVTLMSILQANTSIFLDFLYKK